MPWAFDRQFFRDFLLDLAADVIGCGIFAIAMRVFIAPNGIAPGGVSGLSVILNHLIPQIQIGAWSLLVNIPLLLMGLRWLGKGFALRTLLTVVILSFMIDYVAVLLPQYQGDVMLAALFGGVLMGIGLAPVYMRGSTTGGGDIISRVLLIRYPHLQMGRILLAIDATVLLLSAAVFGRIETALYGLVTVFSSSKLIDSLLYGMDTGKLVYIMSQKADEITQNILCDLQRGCTLLRSIGGYSGQDAKVILVAVRRHQYFPLKRLVRRLDPGAFVIATDSSEVLGQGFKPFDQG